MNDTINRYLAILCYPFSSLDFFKHDYFETIIQSKPGKGQEEEIQELKRTLINYMQGSYYIYSYDEIYMYLEKCYLYELRNHKYACASELYLECFQKIMHTMLSQRDGKIVFKYWKNEEEGKFLGGFGDANKIFLFHSMNMHMPLDFLVMLYLTQNDKNEIQSLDYYYGQIDVADQQLDVVMRAGVAENHLHKGVSLSFFELWEDFMMPVDAAFTRAMKEKNIRLSDGNIEAEEGLLFLLTASVVRAWIAAALHRGGKGFEFQSGESRDEIELKNIIKRFENGEELEQFYKEKWGTDERETVRNEIFSFFQKLWDTLLQMLPEQEEGRSLLQSIFEREELHTSDECIFWFYAMQYLKEHKENPSAEERRITKCILQYLRVRNFVFERIVQKKTVRGLDFFQQEYYSRDSKMNQLFGAVNRERGGEEAAKTFWKRAMRKQFQNRDLKKIEFRASIDDNEMRFRKNVKIFLEAYRDVICEDYCVKREGRFEIVRPFPRVGLVFHLLKQPDKDIPQKCFLDGIVEPERMLYGVHKKRYEDQIKIMRNVRDEVSGIDRYIVGIDAASLENATPVWTFVSAYEAARDSSIEKIGYGGMGTQSLRFTFHAGEDFRHILSGLRRMDEAVTFLKFHAGDRIGHGTALGIVPQQWRRSNPFVVLPGIEALENYVWAYYLLSQNTISVESTLLAHIERRINELAKEIYGKSDGISLQTLIEGYLRMFHSPSEEYRKKCKEAEDIGFCEAVRSGKCDEIVWNGKKIALARHCKKFLAEMERPIHYEVTDQDIQITELLQQVLRQKLSRSGIVVEVNPSSNVAIGEVDKIIDNQIYQLNSPGGAENVMVCINSDDPTVFHTNVSNEFAYIYYGLLHNGVSREIALDWIDKVRECGMRASFIQDDGSPGQVYEELERIIDAL